MSDEEKKVIVEINDDELNDVSGGYTSRECSSHRVGEVFKLYQPCPQCGEDAWILFQKLEGSNSRFICKGCQLRGKPPTSVEADLHQILGYTD